MLCSDGCVGHTLAVGRPRFDAGTIPEQLAEVALSAFEGELASLHPRKGLKGEA